jgi:hypothetical protein
MLNRLTHTLQTTPTAARSAPPSSQPSAPRVLQSSRVPQQMAFVFHRG